MQTTANGHALRGVACVALGGVLWGFSGTCGQYLFANWPVSSLWLTCVRVLSAGVLLIAMAAVRDRESLTHIWHDRRSVVELVLFGLLGLVPCQLSYMTAISYSNAATTTVLQNLSLIFIMLISCAVARRLPRRVEVFSLCLAFFGTWVLATGGSLHALSLSPKGLAWGLACAGAVTVYTLMPRRLLAAWGRETVIGAAMLIGGTALNLGVRSWRFSVSLPWQGWLAVAAIVALGTVASFSLFMQGLKDIGPVKTSMLAATEPVAATVFSALWLGTRFSAADFLGFGCILATIFLLAREP